MSEFEQISEEELDLSQEADLELTDPMEIQRLLALTPKLIQKCEEKVQQADALLDIAEDHLEVEKAKAHLQARNDDELTAAEDRKAFARTQPQVMEAQVAVINARRDVKLAQLMMRKYERYDTNVRKAANIFEVLSTAEMARMKHGRN